MPESVVAAGATVPVWMVTAPLPVMVPASVWLTVLETTNAPSLAMAPRNVPEPSTPASESFSVLSAATAIRPVDVLVPVRKSVPAPECVREPVPEIAPPSVWLLEPE